METVRVRFAPSPTGYFHIGSARTALFNWLYARHHSGKFVLRIEDTDQERNTPEALRVLLDGMRWLGLNWDEGPEVGGSHGPYFQSERNEIYKKYIERLKEKGSTYEKDGALYFKLEGERYTEYDNFHKAEIEKVKAAPQVFQDAVRGKITRAEERDFVIVRKNGAPVFHLVNVIDDIDMGITHVIRGEDHLSNTSKHAELFKAFDAPLPTFAHIPLILKSNGPGKMSKRDEGAIIEEYEQRQFLPEALVNFLCLLGWSPKDDQEIMPISEIIQRFDFDGINKNNARFDEKKLASINSSYLRNLPKNVFLDKAKPLILEANNGKEIDGPYLDAVIELCQEKVISLEDLPNYVSYFFDDAFTEDPKAKKRVFKKGDPIVRLEELLAAFKTLEITDLSSFEKAIESTAEKHSEKPTNYFQPLRFALSGTVSGPDLMKMLSVLGKDRIVSRIEKFLDNVENAKTSLETQNN